MVNLRKSQRGFTLLEMMVVIAIIGITASVAMPRFSRMQTSIDFDASQRIILSTMNTCSRLSKSKNRDVYLVFLFSTEQMKVYIDEDQDNSVADESSYMVKTLPSTINLAGIGGSTATDTLVFTSYGSTNQTFSLHFAPKTVSYVNGQEDNFRTIIPSNSSQKPRYYSKGVNTPFPAPS